MCGRCSRRVAMRAVGHTKELQNQRRVKRTLSAIENLLASVESSIVTRLSMKLLVITDRKLPPSIALNVLLDKS